MQWDTTLNFFNNENYLKDSTGKGHYSGSLINTGSNENYKVKNIYDMAGNVTEWTMEAYTTNRRIYRGGFYNTSGSCSPASNRDDHNTTASADSIGFRLALYF